MDVVILTIRTLFFYFMIILALHLLLKKKKISLADLLIAFMIAQLAVVGIDQPAKPLVTILLPILLLYLLHRVFGPVFRKKDEPYQSKRKEPDRPSDLAPFKWPATDVEMATLEPVTVNFPIGPLPLPLILDGQVMDENLQKIGQTRFWLKNEVQRFGVHRFKQVAYCSIDSNGRFFLDKKQN